MIEITLSDGTKLTNLVQNGDNFIAENKIDSDIFENNLSPVTIKIDDTIEEHAHMELVQIVRNGNDYWFVLRDLTDSELREIKLRADIDYIAMMTDVNIEEE